MSEKTYLKLCAALGRAKWEARRQWLNCWQPYPGAVPMSDLAESWAVELQELNDAHAEVQRLYDALCAARV